MSALPHDRVTVRRWSEIDLRSLYDCCRYQRPPLPFDPEAVWQQSDLDLSTTAGFLHENCLHFLEDSAIQDAALESEFFSDAGAVLPPALGGTVLISLLPSLPFAMHAEIVQLSSNELAEKQPLKGAPSAGSTSTDGWTCTLARDCTRPCACADRMSSRSFASSAAYLDADLGPASSALQAAAASLLLRGLLFAAVEQAPRRWLPLRKSAWGTAQQGVAANLAQLRGLVWARTGSA